MTRLNLDPSWRREILAILGLTIVAAGLRFSSFGRLAIDHFDEGIYVSAASWSLGPEGLSGIDPGLIPYGPPGYPILVGAAFGVLGMSDLTAIAVSILAGVATIPIVAWMSARRIDRGAAVASATLATFSGLAIVFSRMALTDATLLAVWCVGIGLGGRFLERPCATRAIGLGLAVGIAQLVKYNGWLVGAIVIGTAASGRVFVPEERKRGRVLRVVGWGGLAAVIAILVDSPWIAFVERHGGFVALLQHQRSYLGEAGTWLGHWSIQLRQATALDGWVGRIGPAVAIGLTVIVRRQRPAWPVLVGLAIGLAPSSTGWWLGLALTPWFVTSPEPGRRLLGVWWLALSVLTPLYHPYARLWLPLEAAGWLMQSFVIVEVLRGLADPARVRVLLDRLQVGAVVVAIVAAWVQTIVPPRAVPIEGILGPRDSLRLATVRLLARLPREVGAVTILGRPAFRFHAGPILAMRRVESRVASSGSDLGQGADWGLIDSVQLAQDGPIAGEIARLLQTWTVLDEEPTSLSPATLLDVDPAAATGRLNARQGRLILIRRIR